MTSTRPLAAIILAAGQGTRMNSTRHKVLHPVAGRPMLLHLLDSVGELAPERMIVVVGAGGEQVAAAVAGHAGVTVVEQAERLGTGHAVAQARAALAGHDGDAIVLYGDAPLVRADTMRRMVDRLRADDAPAAVVLGFRPADAGAYGRIVADEAGRIATMVEYRDADDAQRGVTLCNSGLMAVRSDRLFALLARVGRDNAAGEYYLPDIVMLAIGDGDAAVVVEAEAGEVAGVNSRAELAALEGVWQAERRARAMAEGATLIAPDTVWFAHDTVLGRDVTVEPNVVFGPGVTVADGATVRAFSHVAGTTVGEQGEVGPYARLRPGTVVGAGARIGNFVEVKGTTIGEGAKASHLSYIGDAVVGAGANIGAGTITCNYDGYAKHRTIIGAGAFIGSNTALVAPVAIGDGAIVGAGSTITHDVDAGALSIARATQRTLAGWARRFRDKMIASRASH